jgi:redox-sensing transcriptional repressor
LNFAPNVLVVPDGVEVRKVDLATELQILAFHQQRRTADPSADPTASAPSDGARRRPKAGPSTSAERARAAG